MLTLQLKNEDQPGDEILPDRIRGAEHPGIAPPSAYRLGRPPSFSSALAAEICARISSGEVLTEICQDGHLPHRSVVYYWIDRHPTFADAYARARGRQAEALAERGVLRAIGATPHTANADRLAFDSLRWLAARLDPARWSERAELQLTVTDPEAARESDRQRAELIAGLQRLAKPEPLILGYNRTQSGEE